MIFKKFELKREQIDEVLPYLELSEALTCDYTMGGMFMWRDYYRIEYCIKDSVFFSRFKDYGDDNYCYFLPLARDMAGACKRLVDYVLKEEDLIRISAIPSIYTKVLNMAGFSEEPVSSRDYADYIYDAGQIKALEGSKYAKQRNHISRFNKDYPNWKYLNIKDVDPARIIDFFKQTYLPELEAFHIDESVPSKHAENLMTLDVLNNLPLYNFCGGAIEVDGCIRGFTLGEVKGNVLYDHIEKADRNFSGIYQMLFHEFVKHEAGDGVLYINREDDAGDEGLRKAKLAYHPLKLEEKYSVTIKKSV